MPTATCCRCATRRRRRKPKLRAPPSPPSGLWVADGMREMQAATATAPFSEQLQVNEMTAIDDSWVLISGASSGFGEEFARQYAEQGHSLVLVARRLDRLQSLAEALIQQYHIDVVVEQVD